jgi:hypothetical protein
MHNQTDCAAEEFWLLAPLSNAVRRIIKKSVVHVLDYRTVWGQSIFNDKMTFRGKRFVSLAHSLFPFPVRPQHNKEP